MCVYELVCVCVCRKLTSTRSKTQFRLHFNFVAVLQSFSAPHSRFHSLSLSLCRSHLLIFLAFHEYMSRLFRCYKFCNCQCSSSILLDFAPSSLSFFLHCFMLYNVTFFLDIRIGFFVRLNVDIETFFQAQQTYRKHKLFSA